MKRLLLLCILGFWVMALAPVLHAATLSFNLDTALNNNPTPPQTTSLVATFVDKQQTQGPPYVSAVELTLKVSGLSSGAYVSGWYFNFDPGFSGSLEPDWTASPGAQDKGAIGGFNVGGVTFNYYFDFSDAFFSSGTSSVLINSLTSPITVESFDNPSSGYYSAAEVVNADGKPSYLGATSSTIPGTVPEPSTLILLGTGLAGVVGLSRKKLL